MDAFVYECGLLSRRCNLYALFVQIKNILTPWGILVY